MKFIKIGIRHNLLYPLMMIIFTFFRTTDSLYMSKEIGFKGSLLLTLIMFLSEAIIGLIFFIRHLKLISEGGNPKLNQTDLIYNSPNPINIEIPDSNLKMYILIFFASFFDFNFFSIQTFYFPKFTDVSKSFDIRVRSLLTISDGFFCYYLLKLKIYKHQKLYLFIIFLSLILVIIIEFLFEKFEKKRNESDFFIALFIMIFKYLFQSFLDIIEKYLIEFDHANIFQILMFEGIFGFLVTSAYSFVENPFKEAKKIYTHGNKDFILLIFCLLIFFITSGGRNIYRIAINKYYSPMARTLTNSFLDPLFIVYYFLFQKDFRNLDDNKNIYYFVINLILSIIIVFCGCIYNELFILLFCNLGYETYFQISKRAKKIDKIYELPDFGEEEDFINSRIIN